ncbi:DUF6207 family protein [Streptomyces mutabilis]|uniref:DUF6207 family protein n=1 Tax=Streptomyces mutabilis TaxID=67332 RepID=UPI0022BA30D1|nr:DUF6207 family protein [Streptomyces mutabilis]MCZ9349313.1 DUF6207 family protein [Streptomyces mutabilis]
MSTYITTGTRKKRRILLSSLGVTAAAVTLAVTSTTSAYASSQTLWQGNDVGTATTSGYVRICDREADGNGAYIEVKWSVLGSHQRVYDANGSKAGRRGAVQEAQHCRTSDQQVKQSRPGGRPPREPLRRRAAWLSSFVRGRRTDPHQADGRSGPRRGECERNENYRAGTGVVPVVAVTNEVHLSEPGLIVVDIAAANDEAAFAFHSELATRWATTSVERTTHEPGRRGVRLRCCLDMRQPLNPPGQPDDPW